MDHPPAPDRHDLAADVVRALTLYCLAEFQSGHATTIRITAQGSSFSIADDGRGHSIDRVVDGTPYLKFIYSHFDYPFETGRHAPVQLQGIGMSLVSALCGELLVTVNKPDATLRMSFREGRRVGSELTSVGSGETGIAVAGSIRPQWQGSAVDPGPLQQWLVGLLAAGPAPRIFFNGRELHAPLRSDT